MGEDEASGINSGTYESMGAQARGQQNLIKKARPILPLSPQKSLLSKGDRTNTE
jgi:hypothetical protein